MTRRAPSCHAFTLVEVLIAATVGALVMSAMLSSFVFLARNFTRLAHHQALEQQARQALAVIQADLAQARAVKPGTSPTATAVTLELPGGDVTYTYDAAGSRLRRQATFGPLTDRTLLNNTSCRCSAFAFNYYTSSQGSPVDQLTPTAYVPYSIKLLQVQFSLETPSTQSPETRMNYDVVSSRFQIRQRQAPDGN